MRIYKANSSDRKRYGISFVFFLVIAVICFFVLILSNYTINKVVQKRMTDETGFLAKQQAQLVSQAIEDEYKNVSTIATMVENGLAFNDEKDQGILEAVVETNRLCMLAYVDENGDVTTYQGKNIGNIKEREYFSKVITGEKEFVCEYLQTTGFGDDPRVIFSAPVKKAEKITGVIFYSKEISTLRDNLFQQSMFNNREQSLLIDSEGSILVKNTRAEKAYESADEIYEIFSKSEKELQNLSEKQSGSIIVGKNSGTVVAYAKIEQNDWYLICAIDEETARKEYAANLTAIKRLIFLSSASFCLGIIYFLILSYIQMKNYWREYEDKRAQYNRIVSLLVKMQCAIFEYNLVDHKIKTNEVFSEIFGSELDTGFPEQIQEHKLAHPEFDFDGFMWELHYAIEKKVTTSFETIFSRDKYTYKMLAVTMMPIIGENEKVTKILGSIRENSTEHSQLKEKVDMLDQIPGGTRRYYLNSPVCLEYVGEKLCKMLKYPEDELRKQNGYRYEELIEEGDRERFRKFIEEAASSPGVRTCQYSLCCKDHTMITVLDTIESIKNDSGVMYGYCVVVDISEYTRRQNIVQQELKQLEKNLENMRINNSASQMQPHFLYNALSSIREVVLQNPKYASDLMYDFTVYLRACIRTMQSGELITIQQEMDNIRAYVNIEKMRMGNRLNMVYDLCSEEFEVPPLSIQPLVENAIRHGVYKRGKKGGTVSVKTDTVEKYNRVIIEDDGVGFDYQKVRDEVEKKERQSIGLDNVMFRLTKQQNAKVVINSKMNVGTRITIWFPKERGKL